MKVTARSLLVFSRRLEYSEGNPGDEVDGIYRQRYPLLVCAALSTVSIIILGMPEADDGVRTPPITFNPSCSGRHACSFPQIDFESTDLGTSPRSGF